MLPLIQREVVDRKGWIDEEEFLNMIAMAQADGVVVPNELAYFEQLQELLHISQAELRSVTATVDNDFSLLGLVDRQSQRTPAAGQKVS